MATRSLNKVLLIGNLTRDPELRYTPAGTPVCSFGLATNRGWTTDTGERKEETEFHRIVAWAKLAELCAKLLYKGRRIFVEGRLQTRQWTGQDGVTRSTTEVIIDDMLLLDSRKDRSAAPQGNYDYGQNYAKSSSQYAPAASTQSPPDQTPADTPASPSDTSSTELPSTDVAADIPSDNSDNQLPQTSPVSTDDSPEPENQSPKASSRDPQDQADSEKSTSGKAGKKPKKKTSDSAKEAVREKDSPKDDDSDIPF